MKCYIRRRRWQRSSLLHALAAPVNLAVNLHLVLPVELLLMTQLEAAIAHPRLGSCPRRLGSWGSDRGRDVQYSRAFGITSERQELAVLSPLPTRPISRTFSVASVDRPDGVT